MGWEVMMKKVHEDTEDVVVKFCFFCNTSDIAFGPVFYLDCNSPGDFYDSWNEVNPGIDPRIHRHQVASYALQECIERMQRHYGMEVEA